jgi:sugar phosphate isomerase/epimerase
LSESHLYKKRCSYEIGNYNGANGARFQAGCRKNWGERFYHVHIKGSLIVDGKRVDDPPAGLDQTDWGSFMAILYSQHYEGGLSIEPHSRTWAGELGDKGIDYTVNMMRTLLFR